MPLIEIRQLTPDTRLGLWRIEEFVESKPRDRERKAVQELLTLMMGGDERFMVGHEDSGKPLIVLKSGNPLVGAKPVDSHISISHTRGYVAILLSEGERVGVDIEYRSDRVEGIASRFIRPDEHADNTDAKLLLWSAKEAVYKYFSEDHLAFFDMRMLSRNNKMLHVENIRRGTVTEVCYEFTADYVLTYCYSR